MSRGMGFPHTYSETQSFTWGRKICSLQDRMSTQASPWSLPQMDQRGALSCFSSLLVTHLQGCDRGWGWGSSREEWPPRGLLSSVEGMAGTTGDPVTLPVSCQALRPLLSWGLSR